MYETLKSSTTIWTPSWSTITSSARRWSSKAMPYCMPEHPPPLTKMRRASPGVGSLASSSLRRDWASGVSETTACSITLGMLPRGFTAAPHSLGRCLPAAQLEPFLFLGLPGARASGDHLSQLLDPARDRALGVREDEDLPLDGRLVRLGPVEIDLDRQLLFQRPDDVLFAHHRLWDLVVEGEDDAARDDVEDIVEDVQQLADVLQGRELWRDQHEHALGGGGDADNDVCERDIEAEDEVAERVDQNANRAVDEVDGDEVGLFGPQHSRQQHHAARVVEDGAQNRFFEVLRRDLAGGGKTARRCEVGDQGGVVVGKGQVDEQDLAREPLGQRGRHVHGYGRPAGASLGGVDGYGRSSLLRRHHA